jgi:hypothetical protein
LKWDKGSCDPPPKDLRLYPLGSVPITLLRHTVVLGKHVRGYRE